MSMTLTQGPSMNSLKKTDRIDRSSHLKTLPTSYAAVIDNNGAEIEITDAQIRKALDAAEDAQLFPYGTRQTPRGRWTATKPPARKLHS